MNREQFIKHVEGTQKQLRRFLVALCCGDTQLADDIAQESYVKAYLSCEDMRDPDRFNSWIYRIAYNTFLDTKARKKDTVDYDSVREMASVDYSDASFRYQELYAALDRLSPKERGSVVLYYLEGYSIKEISEMEEVSQESVRQHLSRGRTHLRSIMAGADK